MSRKQVGAIDAELLAEVDRRAEWLGQTRRVFIERTLQERVARPDWKITSGHQFVQGAEQALSEAKEPPSREQADPGSVPSSEGVTSAAPAERPRDVEKAFPSSNGRMARSSLVAKRDVRPVPKAKP